MTALLAGPWKKLKQSVWISPNTTGRWVYDLEFACTTGRRYRFLVKQFDSNDHVTGEHWYYCPSNNNITHQLTLDLGDLSRFF